MTRETPDVLNPMAWLQAWQQAVAPGADAPPAAPLAPDTLAALQREFAGRWAALAEDARQGRVEGIADRRFAGQAWTDSPAHAFMAQAYLLSADMLTRMADGLEVAPALRERIRFATMQWVEAMAPSNFLALNPEAQRRCIESQGESLQQGLANLLADLGKGRISQTDETSFEVGGNLAVTPGAVVHENPLFQLIQYTPPGPRVHARPLLVVPPCINKFYILDLQPQNSLVRYALEQGMQVFLVSWRNPLPDDADPVDQVGWDDYLEHGVIEALAAVREITGQAEVNTLGFCVGGTLLAAALAVLKARGENWAASMTLLTAMLDFDDTGVLDVFIDDAHVALREQQFAAGGLLPARDLASTFAFLRPNDLVWNYVVRNYLKGESPPPFDLLYWNADSTNLPGPFYAWYLRHTYLENRLKVPGAVHCCGVPVDFSRLDMPAYLYGSREDHIVPWASAYASTRLLAGPQRFVLGASGHIAGVINPPAGNRRHYWVGDGTLPGEAQQWFAGARQVAGSWWPDWAEWLRGHAGPLRAAPVAPGSAGYPPIEPAPGRYVRARAV